MRAALVVTQVALALVLLAGAGLVLKSFWHAQNAPLGFDPHGIVTFPIALPEAKYKTDQQKDAFWTALLERVKNIRGVEAAATELQLQVVLHLAKGVIRTVVLCFGYGFHRIEDI